MICGPWSDAAPPRSDDSSYLLRTRWSQDGPFAQFTPDHCVLGCWSTAYAQILYYHRLTPTGRVRYECSSGYEVDVDLGDYAFDWNKFPDEGAAPAMAGFEQPALFSYATAVAVRKDFGTGKYKRILNSVPDLEAHFSVDAEIYVQLGDSLPLSPADLADKLQSEGIENIVNRDEVVALLESELAAKRPVYFHFGNMIDFGHSTVIDGIRRKESQIQVHINYGADEIEKNAWYDLFAPIAQPDDLALRAYVTIRPHSPSASGSAPPEASSSSSEFDWGAQLDDALSRHHVPAGGIAVIRGGRLEAAVVSGELESGKRAPQDALFNVASLTKPVFLQAVLTLIDRGAIELDEPLSRHWIDPDLSRDSRVHRLTPRVVLAHQTGFPNWRDGAALKFNFAPGEGVGYSGEGFEYLRRAIEKKTGQTMPQFVSESVFAPCGMVDSYFTWDPIFASRYALEHDATGYRVIVPPQQVACAADDLLTTIADYGRFAAFVARGGGLSPLLYKEMCTSQAARVDRANSEGSDDYGLGWRLLETEHATAIAHGGADRGVRAGVIIVPASRDGVVVMTNGDNGGAVIEEMVLLAISHGGEILKAYLDR
jgi:CubicO group peptidase (beta-lactamase class C family)